MLRFLVKLDVKLSELYCNAKKKKKKKKKNKHYIQLTESVIIVI